MGVASLVGVPCRVRHGVGLRFDSRPLPDPNGYDVLVRAAAKLTLNDKKPTTNELAPLLATNKAALLELRGALDLPSAVPVPMGDQWIALIAQTTNTAHLRFAAATMVVEIFHRQRQGDLAGALDEWCDLLRYGQAVSRYGVMIDVLVRTACEAMAVRTMTNLLSSLNAEQCKRAANQLERHELQRESFDEIIGREKEWQRKTLSLAARLEEAFEIHILGQKPPGRIFVPDVEKECHSRALELRRLMLAVASRAFELERRQKPQRASDLVPVYLRTLRTEPVSGVVLQLP